MKNRPIPPLTESDLKRFWDKVDVRGPNECWEWTAGTSKGYGVFGFGHSSTFLAPRISYAIEYGDPGDDCVCHSCDNPPCCNPAHLWVGTKGDNNRDMYQKGRARPTVPKGEKSHLAKLTEQDVRAIRKSNELHHILAERYGVCRSAIGMVKSRKSWKHIT